MNNNILCIGEVLWDCFPKGKYPGGAPFNTACHLQMLGEKVNFVSRIGVDADGTELLEVMKQKNINTDYIQHDAKSFTGRVNVKLDDAGFPSYDIIYPAAWDNIEDTPGLTELAAKCNVLVFGTLAQRDNRTRSAIKKLREIIPLKVLDVNLRPPYDYPEIIESSLKGSQIIKLNEHELLQICRWFGFPEDIKAAVYAIANKYKCDTICITKGEKGAVLLHKQLWSEHPGYSVKVMDSVGAGDAFLASLISGLLADRNSDDILKDANATGAFVASRDGAVPPLIPEEIEKIRSRS